MVFGGAPVVCMSVDGFGGHQVGEARCNSENMGLGLGTWFPLTLTGSGPSQVCLLHLVTTAQLAIPRKALNFAESSTCQSQHGRPCPTKTLIFQGHPPAPNSHVSNTYPYHELIQLGYLTVAARPDTTTQAAMLSRSLPFLPVPFLPAPALHSRLKISELVPTC